jgi:hypothetical protein
MRERSWPSSCGKDGCNPQREDLARLCEFAMEHVGPPLILYVVAWIRPLRGADRGACLSAEVTPPRSKIGCADGCTSRQPSPVRSPVGVTRTHSGRKDGCPRNLHPPRRAHAQLIARQRFARAERGAAAATSVHLGAVACATHEQTMGISQEIWRRRPDLNRGWRFCRQGRIV